MFSQIPGGEGNNFEKVQEGPGNGHGRFSEEELDEPTKRLAEEFSFFGNIKNLSKITPHVCRKGCKHYDSVGDQKSAEFREFCWKSKESRIERGSVCRNFESKNPDLPEGILTF